VRAGRIRIPRHSLSHQRLLGQLLQTRPFQRGFDFGIVPGLRPILAGGTLLVLVLGSLLLVLGTLLVLGSRLLLVLGTCSKKYYSIFSCKEKE
jgi:hypothetical protein